MVLNTTAARMVAIALGQDDAPEKLTLRAWSLQNPKPESIRPQYLHGLLSPYVLPDKHNWGSFFKSLLHEAVLLGLYIEWSKQAN